MNRLKPSCDLSNWSRLPLDPSIRSSKSSNRYSATSPFLSTSFLSLLSFTFPGISDHSSVRCWSISDGHDDLIPYNADARIKEARFCGLYTMVQLERRRIWEGALDLDLPFSVIISPFLKSGAGEDFIESKGGNYRGDLARTQEIRNHPLLFEGLEKSSVSS